MIPFALTLFCYLAFSFYCATKINKERYLSLWLILFLVFILLSVEILGIFNIFSSLSLLILALTFILPVLIFEFRNLRKFRGFTLNNPFQTVKLSSVLFIFLVLSSAVVVYSEFSPIAEIDSIAYHLPIVSKIITTGGIWEPFYAGFVGPNTYFPANHEAMQAFFAVQTGNMNFGYIVTFLSFLLLCSSLFDLGRKRVSSLFILVVALSSASAPFLFNQFLNLQIDLFMFSLFGGGIALIVSSVLNEDKLDLAKGLLVLGLLAGSKYNAAPQIIALVPLLILVFIYFRKSFKSVFWYPILAVVPGIFWYIRNWIIAGNPIYPFGLHLGFINFEGHKGFIADTVGTSLLNFIGSDGVNSAISHISNNKYFGTQLGNVSLLLIAIGLLSATGVLIYIIFRAVISRKHDKKQMWTIICVASLLYVFFAEFYIYINSPFTYSLWNQTIRYASPVFALIPIFFILSAFQSRIIYFILFYFAAGVLLYNILLKSFLFNTNYLQLISDKASLIPDMYILSLIFIVFLVVFLFSLLIQQKKTRIFPALLLLFIISSSISFSQFRVSPLFVKNTKYDDQFIFKESFIYPLILPHIEKLRELRNDKPEIIALGGLTPYWLFEKEGYTPVYVNIDGCLECQYPYYRNAEDSIRANPDAVKWKSSLKALDVKYLIVDFLSFSKDKEPYEEIWAKSDKKMFTLLQKNDSVSLYRIN